MLYAFDTLGRTMEGPEEAERMERTLGYHTIATFTNGTTLGSYMLTAGARCLCGHFRHYPTATGWMLVISGGPGDPVLATRRDADWRAGLDTFARTWAGQEA